MSGSTDPFADGANPFASIGYEGGTDDLPPLTVTPGPSTNRSPSTDGLDGTAPPHAGAPPASAPAADDSNPFAKIGFEGDAPAKPPAPSGSGAGPLSNNPNDGFMSGTLKNIGTTAIRGVSHVPGFVGDIGDFADALTEIPEYVESKITGQPFADVVAKRDTLGAQSTAAHDAKESRVLGFSLDPRRYLPSGAEVAAPILAKTGAYQPTTTLGRYGSAIGETALGGLGPGGGGTIKGLAEGAATGLLPGAARIAQAGAQHAPVNALAGASLKSRGVVSCGATGQ